MSQMKAVPKAPKGFNMPFNMGQFEIPPQIASKKKPILIVMGILFLLIVIGIIGYIMYSRNSQQPEPQPQQQQLPPPSPSPAPVPSPVQSPSPPSAPVQSPPPPPPAPSPPPPPPPAPSPPVQSPPPGPASFPPTYIGYGTPGSGYITINVPPPPPNSSGVPSSITVKDDGTSGYGPLDDKYKGDSCWGVQGLAPVNLCGGWAPWKPCVQSNGSWVQFRDCKLKGQVDIPGGTATLGCTGNTQRPCPSGCETSYGDKMLFSASDMTSVDKRCWLPSAGTSSPYSS